MAGPPLEKLQELIGYRFREPKLLLEALTHSSFVNETSDGSRDNERMEFLGDAILNFVVCVRLTDVFPQCEEGKLTLARAKLIAAPHLSEVAARLGVGEYLRLGPGEQNTGGQFKPRLRVNALEALIAALYRDGGLQVAWEFVEKYIMPSDILGSAEELFLMDYKTTLQEHLSAERHVPAEYRVVDEIGPQHQKMFTVEVTAGKNLAARGRGVIKKAAEQQAARALLDQLGKKTEIDG